LSTSKHLLATSSFNNIIFIPFLALVPTRFCDMEEKFKFQISLFLPQTNKKEIGPPKTNP
jgi:glycopeptide antibiotics resistance protein